ncbi:hypothetical protein [Caniella muris]|uniref:hypothetical protein n=1 Tax=Caniella muris TaxID=2941502 RepID=UPI00203F9A6C|nr:hypothetical protein [Caniella muris]
MGQYFVGVLRKKGSDDFLLADPGSLKDGLKLTEHAYANDLGTPGSPCVGEAVSAAMGALKEAGATGAQVWWMGDYADDVLSNTDVDGVAAWKAAWKNSNKATPLSNTLDGHLACQGFLVNLSRKLFVDILASLGLREVNCFGHFCCAHHPLPLLCAVGNGQGGGDYYGPDSADEVGAWAGDTIAWCSKDELEGFTKEGFEELKVRFLER